MMGKREIWGIRKKIREKKMSHATGVGQKREQRRGLGILVIFLVVFCYNHLGNLKANHACVPA